MNWQINVYKNINFNILYVSRLIKSLQGHSGFPQYLSADLRATQGLLVSGVPTSGSRRVPSVPSVQISVPLKVQCKPQGLSWFSLCVSGFLRVFFLYSHGYFLTVVIVFNNTISIHGQVPYCLPMYRGRPSLYSIAFHCIYQQILIFINHVV